jgi:NADH:ubiquinone oxidoreductase subunit 5 (subunit L)/multisubunit Na+/H+ antiporter MnhA subunit
VTLLVGAGLAVVQRDVKRMLAYSSINHAGFILLGLYAASASGVSASLYYLFAYTFMVIGSFAVVTVLGRRGDAAHDISSYRGLARRQPVLAVCFAVLLLGQAGAPFTAGLWAKLQVVQAAIDANGVPLGAIAMVSAAVAVFFYLRVAVLMYTPLPDAGAEAGVEEPAEDMVPLLAGPPELFPDAVVEVAGAGGLSATSAVPAGIDRQSVVTRQLNASLLLDTDPLTGALRDAPAYVGTPGGERVMVGDGGGPEWGATIEGAGAHEATEDVEVGAVATAGPVRVPALSVIAIGVCVAVTVLFGFLPSPLTDFAHHATLLFQP